MLNMERKIKTARFFAKLLDAQFEIGGVKFGLDPIINIVPWVGTLAGAMLSMFILHTAYSVGASKADLARMIGNIVVDFIVGLIPFLGVIFDVIYKANSRNMKILEKYSHGKFVEGQVLS